MVEVILRPRTQEELSKVATAIIDAIIESREWPERVRSAAWDACIEGIQNEVIGVDLTVQIMSAARKEQNRIENHAFSGRVAQIEIPVENQAEAEEWFHRFSNMLRDVDWDTAGVIGLTYEDESNRRFSQSLSNYDAGEPLEPQD